MNLGLYARVVVIASVLIGVAAAQAQVDERSALERGESVVLPSERCGDFFIVESMIDGRGPFRMVMDTGASITTLTPEAHREAGQPRLIQSIKMGEVTVTGRIRVDARELGHLEDALGTRIDGIMGHQVFQSSLLTYDYPAGEVRVRMGELSDDEPGVAPMSTSKRPFIGAMVGNRHVNVLLDTGSSNGLTLGAFDRWTFEKSPPVVGGSIGVDGLSAVRSGRLVDDVVFGSFVLQTPIVRSTGGDALLGQAILRNFVVTVDQRRGRVQIVKPDGSAIDEPIASPSLHSASWVVWPEDDHLLVRHVVDGGAAADAGFQRGDRIRSVNGIEWTDIGCERHGGSGAEAETTRYQVQRDGEIMELELTTRLVVR